jgi:peroxiredoxin
VTVVLLAVLAAVLAAAGVLKAIDLPKFADVLVEFGLRQELIRLVSRAVPAAEVVIATALLVPAASRAAAVAAAALLTGFTIALARTLLAGRRPACNCFGTLGRRETGWDSVLRNLVLIAFAAFVAASASAGTHNGLVAAIAISGGLAVVSFALFRDNKDLRARVQRLEREVAEGAARGTLPSRGLPPGSPAPEFAMQALDRGTPVTLTSCVARGLPVLLIFTAAGCPACRVLLRSAARWQVEFADYLTIVLAASGDPTALAGESDRHAGMTVGLDSDQAVSQAFKSDGTPQAVLIGPGKTLISDLARNKDEIEVVVEILVERAAAKAGNGFDSSVPEHLRAVT